MKGDQEMITDVLMKDKTIDFAYLFGSRATGLAGRGSDWDIAVFYRRKKGHPDGKGFTSQRSCPAR